jgi:mRNA interferase HicA
MKRDQLVRYLRTNDCILLREGGRHSWWFNPTLNKRSAVPRHTEISDFLQRKSVKTLGSRLLNRKIQLGVVKFKQYKYGMSEFYMYPDIPL